MLYVSHFVLRGVTVRSIDGAASCESRPEGEWNAGKKQLTWAIPKIPPSTSATSLYASFNRELHTVRPQSLHPMLTSSDHTLQQARPATLSVSFTCNAMTQSGIEFLFARQGLTSMEALEKTTKAGVYKVDPQ